MISARRVSGARRESELTMMKIGMLCVVGMAMAHGVAALDAVQNEFWDTTGYVNATPVVQDGAMSEAFVEGFSAAPAILASFDSWAGSRAVSSGLDKMFNSTRPAGLMLLFR